MKPRKTDKTTRALVEQMWDEGKSGGEIARRIGISTDRVYKLIKVIRKRRMVREYRETGRLPRVHAETRSFSL